MQKRFLVWDNPKSAVIAITIILMVAGAINVYSASFVAASAMFGNNFYYLYRYGMFGVLGLVVMWFLGFKCDYHKWLNWHVSIFWLFMALLVCVDAFGVTTKGAQRWLVIAGFSFQPSEFVKMVVIVVGAQHLGTYLQEGRRITFLNWPSNKALIQAVALAGMVLIQPDMGTAAIIMALMIVLYITAGTKLSEFWAFCMAAVAGVVVLIAIAPYRLNRLKVWLDPWQDPQGTGYQMVQSLTSIGSGGWIGSGIGMGTGKFFFLPEAHTDFAFAIFCQEWGFIPAIALIAVFLVLAKAIYTIARNTTDEKGYLLVTGINFFIVGQAVSNMAMVCGIFPVIGVPLPFISYGGTSLIATLGAIGLVIAVYNNEVKKELHPKPTVIHSRYEEEVPSYRKNFKPSSNEPLKFRPRGWHK